MAREGTFVVVHPDETAPILRDAHDGQVLTLRHPPDLPDGPLTEGEVLVGTLEPGTPEAVAWEVGAVEKRWTVTVTTSPEPPTTQALDLAETVTPGEVVTRERAGTGELHVLPVPADRTDAAVREILEDEATLERAARLGVGRVEVRSQEGVVSVRYLP